jgi:hypothetical protein
VQSSQPTTQAFIRTRIKAFTRLQKVDGAVHAQRASVEHMRVDHGCFHILMAHQLLNRADVLAAFKEVGSEGVAEGVGRGRLCDAGRQHGLAHCFLDHAGIQVVAPLLAPL